MGDPLGTATLANALAVCDKLTVEPYRDSSRQHRLKGSLAARFGDGNPWYNGTATLLPPAAFGIAATTTRRQCG